MDEDDNPAVEPSKLTDKLSCEVCDIEFVRYFTLKRHVQKKHPDIFKDFVQKNKKTFLFKCSFCTKQFKISTGKASDG